MAFIKKKVKRKLPKIPEPEEEDDEDVIEEDDEEEEEEIEEIKKEVSKKSPQNPTKTLSKQEVGDLVEVSLNRTLELLRYYRSL